MTVQGPVKKQQPDGMSHGGWGGADQLLLAANGVFNEGCCQGRVVLLCGRRGRGRHFVGHLL